MQTSVVRGLVPTGSVLQRPWARHMAQARLSSAESAAAGLVTRKWAERRASLRLCQGMCQRRFIHNNGDASVDSNGSLKLDEFKKYFTFPPQSNLTEFQVGKTVTVHGFISKRRDISSKLSFVDLTVDCGPAFQFKSSWELEESPEHQLHKTLKSVPAWSSVCLTGKIDECRGGPAKGFGPRYRKKVNFYDLTLQDLHVLGPFPKDIIISEGAVFPPPARHLQIRFDQVLRDRLDFRNHLTQKAREYFLHGRLLHVETPILFKSTPEGAREFLVPTRRPGYAYALPQSPQQYKQILMAAGVGGYFQFARCFRDEDLRADRQPEFTQLDLEMSFAVGLEVMDKVERLVCHLYDFIRQAWRLREVNGELFPVPKSRGNSDDQPYPDIFPVEPGEPRRHQPFPRITYQEAMSLYGSDKPDLRIPNKIQRIDHLLPESFTSMVTHLKDPAVEACVFRFPKSPEDFVKSVWDNLPKPLRNNPDGQPVPLIIDSSKPLSGLSTLGHEAAEKILSGADSQLPHLGRLEEGDLLIIQARPNAPFSGGSTALGNLRTHIYAEAIKQGLLPFDRNFEFLWVTGFPLFTPNNDTDPGQGGSSGFRSTHHPFTAPLTPEDFDLIATDPLRAKADHYDLVVNGVELGGGSRRIHIAAVQEYVFREVLKMSDEGVAHFSHLLEALRAGCPPHAGFAFGWDRLVATLSYTASVRDVIAFPKSKKGDEPVTNSPGRVTEEEWGVYNLKHKE